MEEIRRAVEWIDHKRQRAGVLDRRRQLFAENLCVRMSIVNDQGDGALRRSIDVGHEVGARLRFPVDRSTIGRLFANHFRTTRGGRDAGRE